MNFDIIPETLRERLALRLGLVPLLIVDASDLGCHEGRITQRCLALPSPIRKSRRSDYRKLPPRARGIDVVVVTSDPAESARGYIHDFHGGALKLIADRERGVLIGATLVTPRAGEILGELALAITLATPLTTLADVIHPFPAFNRVLGESLGDLAVKVARQTVA
jgi:hypothetical protein